MSTQDKDRIECERLLEMRNKQSDTQTDFADCMISKQAAIDTEGLDEEIRCEMCRNPMHTDRGCDGNCKYDEKLYEKIMQILDKRITPLPSAQPEPLVKESRTLVKDLVKDTISRRAAIELANILKDDLPDDERIADAVMAHNEGILEYQTKLSLLPSAQPEIIRCRDCKYQERFLSSYVCKWVAFEPTDEKYCSFAERRTDD